VVPMISGASGGATDGAAGNALGSESVQVLLRPVVESRPPAHRFGDAGPTGIDDSSGWQPSLLDVAPQPPAPTAGPPRPRGARIHIDTSPGAVFPADGLPDPAGWAALLGLGIAQALTGTRPISQLDTWLDPVVLADLRYAARLSPRRSAAGRESVRVQSVRVQCPTPTSVEATVHLRVGTGSIILGARMEADGRRWVCTALARPTGPSRSTNARSTTARTTTARSTTARSTTAPPRARGTA
jgi:hypothetical protein